MEKYSIRADFGRLVTDLQICKGLVLTFNTQREHAFENDFKIFLDLQKRFSHIADMCKQQSLNTVGRINPHIAMSACANFVVTIKAEYLQDINSPHIAPLIEKISRTLDNLIDNVKSKLTNLAIQEAAERKEDSPKEEPTLQPNGSYKDFTDAAAKMLQNFEQVQTEAPKDPDELFYEKLNKRLGGEKEQLKLDLEDLKNNSFKIIKGSVSINHFFRPDAISHIDHSVISFKGISFNRQRHETIAPIHVFHDQLLVAIKVCPTKFAFRSTELTDKERQERTEKNFSKIKLDVDNHMYYNEGPQVDFTSRFNRGYLASKSFPRVRFIWFVPPQIIPLFNEVKEGAVALLWD